jgi:hypothetical protein
MGFVRLTGNSTLNFDGQCFPDLLAIQSVFFSLNALAGELPYNDLLAMDNVINSWQW